MQRSDIFSRIKKIESKIDQQVKLYPNTFNQYDILPKINKFIKYNKKKRG